MGGAIIITMNITIEYMKCTLNLKLSLRQPCSSERSLQSKSPSQTCCSETHRLVSRQLNCSTVHVTSERGVRELRRGRDRTDNNLNYTSLYIHLYMYYTCTCQYYTIIHVHRALYMYKYMYILSTLLYPYSTPALPYSQSQVWKSANPDFVIFFLFFFKRPTA